MRRSFACRKTIMRTGVDARSFRVRRNSLPKWLFNCTLNSQDGILKKNPPSDPGPAVTQGKSMRAVRLPTSLIRLAAGLIAASLAVGAAPASAQDCAGLAGLGVPHVKITSAATVGADGFAEPVREGRAGQHYPEARDFCRVQGIASPVPGSRIGFEVWLPASAMAAMVPTSITRNWRRAWRAAMSRSRPIPGIAAAA
jgi:hypothetical protein